MKIRIADFGRELQRCATANCHNGPLWVGVAGAPGSGKSTLAEHLKDEFEGGICVIPMDGYHFRRVVLNQMEDPETAYRRREAPFTFDANRFIQDLLDAKQRGSGSFPKFEHLAGDPVEHSIQYQASEVSIVLVEGNYLLLDLEPWCRLKEDVFDVTCWLGVPVDVCCERVHRRNLSLGMTAAQSHQKIENNDRVNAELVDSGGSEAADWILTGATAISL